MSSAHHDDHDSGRELDIELVESMIDPITTHSPSGVEPLSTTIQPNDNSSKMEVNGCK